MGNFKYDVAVIGLGYVGLPLAIQATDSNLNVYGYDIDEDKVNGYNLGKSAIEDISDLELERFIFIL
jgi:UDP-N-acetyl-D-mannosaminuronate dehydrogenase